MSLLSRSKRTQEYITQIFSHCCKVFVGICSHQNTVESIRQVARLRFMLDWTCLVSRPQNTKRFFTTTEPFRILPLYLIHPLTRYVARAAPTQRVDDVTFCSLYSVPFFILCFQTHSPGPDAGVKVFLSPGLWEHSGLHDTGEWWGNSLLFTPHWFS